MTDRTTVAMLGPLAPDLKAGLEAEMELVPPEALAAMPEERRARIERAVTMAVVGAPAEILDLLPGLRRIASCGAGMDKFDEGALSSRGIELLPTPHVMTEDTAEMAVALIFALFRQTVQNDAHVRSGAWADARAGLGRRISGSRAGIVGLGRIGRSLARRLDALGMEVAYTGRSEKADAPWRFVAAPEALAAEVDVLCLTCAGGAETRHLVNAGVLSALGPEGFVVNVSRGSVVDEEALIEALSAGGIAGAGLDVFENEPEPDRRFRELPNLVLSPHAAVFTRENRRDLVAEMRRLLS